MTQEQRDAALRALAQDLQGIDVPVYAEAGVDPLSPILGAGDPKATIGVFGRDPGRHEVLHQTPFVGQGGQKIRAALHRVRFGTEPPDFDAALAVGQSVFWANTVPYKPLGNKAWSTAVKRRFAPLVRDLLLHEWTGRDMLCLGREAFLWFGLGDRETARQLDAFWRREDRYESSCEVELRDDHGGATFRLHPLPHPSPLNATWAPHFGYLADARLRALGWGDAPR